LEKNGNKDIINDDFSHFVRDTDLCKQIEDLDTNRNGDIIDPKV